MRYLPARPLALLRFGQILIIRVKRLVGPVLPICGHSAEVRRSEEALTDAISRQNGKTFGRILSLWQIDVCPKQRSVLQGDIHIDISGEAEV